MTLDLQFTCLQFEDQALVVQLGVGHGVLVCEPGGFEVILGFFVIDLRDRFDLVARLRAAAFALGCNQRDVGQIDVFTVVEGLLLGFDFLPVELNAEAVERGLFLLQLVLQVGTVDAGQWLSLCDTCACLDEQRDGARGGRK